MAGAAPANHRHIDIATARDLAGRVADHVSRLGEAAKAAGLSVTAAESCTGGMVCAAIVADPAASPMLERGFVVYSVDAKCELLGLDRQEVEDCAGVSEHIARAMARAALRESGADIAMAITGFAGPAEGDEEAGLVHLAAARGGEVVHQAVHLGDIGRTLVCEAVTALVLDMGHALALRADEAD